MRTDKFLSILVSSLALLPSSRCSQTFSRDSDGTVSPCFGGSTGCSGSSTLTTHQSEQRGIAFTQGETGGKIQSLGKRYEYAQACYGEPLPDIPGSKERRTTPWGSREMVNAEAGESCCTSLEEVRRGIDAVDKQLLELLAKRAAYVREATRFKSTRETVDVPSRDRQVIEQAVEKAPQYHLPRVIARTVFGAIINASVNFELCVFDSYESSTQP